MSTIKVTNLKNESFTGDQLYLKTDGKIGIGTASPDRHLTLNASATTRFNIKTGSSSTAGIEFGDSDDFNAGYIVYDNSDNSFIAGTNGTGEKVRIDSSGKVGIGTSSPDYTLDVRAASGDVWVSARGGTNQGFQVRKSDNTLRGYAGNGAGINLGAEDFAISAPAGNLSLCTGGTAASNERLRIDSSGRVIIGANSVGSANTYSNNLVVSEASGDAGISIQGNNSNSNYASLYLSDAGAASRAYLEAQLGTNGNFTIGCNGSGATRFLVNAAERMRIDSSGRVGIGTSSPARILDVIASSGITQAYIEKNSGSTNNTYQAALTLSAETSGSASSNYGPGIAFQHCFGASNYAGCLITSQCDADVNTSSLRFYPRNYGYSEALRIDAPGRVKCIQHPTTRTNTVDNYTAEGGYLLHYVARTTSGADRYRRMFDIASVGDSTWGAALRFSTNPDGNANTTERMRITHEGKIGIGQTTPNSMLAITDAGSVSDPTVQAHITGSNGGNLGFGLYSDVNSKYTFKVSNNGRVHINDGIDFSMNSNAGGMDSEVLDDYEEGTFTFAFAGGVTVTNSGTRYVKIGQLVHLTGKVVFGTSGSNTVVNMTGLPFSAHGTPINSSMCGPVGETDCGISPVNFCIENSAQTIRIRKNNQTALQITEVSGHQFRFTLSYLAAT